MIQFRKKYIRKQSTNHTKYNKIMYKLKNSKKYIEFKDRLKRMYLCKDKEQHIAIRYNTIQLHNLE